MRYHVMYLSVGERQTVSVEAPDAAAAVAAVEAVQTRAQRAFELLLVQPARNAERTTTSGGSD